MSKTSQKFIIYVVLSLIDQCISGTMSFTQHSLIAIGLKDFRLSKETFLFLCEKLKPIIKCMDTRLCNAPCVQHRVAITLWCLATCGEYHTIQQHPYIIESVDTL